jgi:glycosyltransferase involved in cell wall biosynthesis
MKSHLASASAIITRSADLARQLAGVGLRKDRLHPVYNGVDMEAFHPATPAERAEARATLGVPDAAPMILFVGNLLPIKNPRALLEAHAELCMKPELRDCHLVLIGGGPLEHALRALAAKLGHGGQVIFAGRHDAAGVARAMRAADALALPSDNEGVPNVILESFASGLPVVASRVGGIAEVHRDFCGQLVPARDVSALATALRATLTSPPDRARIAEHGRAFTWAATAEACHQLLS